MGIGEHDARDLVLPAEGDRYSVGTGRRERPGVRDQPVAKQRAPAVEDDADATDVGHHESAREEPPARRPDAAAATVELAGNVPDDDVLELDVARGLPEDPRDPTA